MRRAVLAVLPLAVAGCASFDKAKGHDQVAATVRERIGAQTGWEQGGPEAEEIARRVEGLLQDGLTPSRAVEIALVNSPRLQATYAELDVSQADLVQAGLLSNPSLELAVHLPIGSTALNELEGGVVQEFVNLFTLPLRKRVAQEQFSADVLRVSHEALAVAAEVKTDVLEFQTQEQLLRLQRASLQASQASADLARRQYAAGNITDLELAERSVAFEQARVEVARSELAIIELRERLNRRLGLWGPQTTWTLRERLADLPEREPLLDRLESAAIEQRLDLAAARTQVALLTKAVSLARNWRYFGSVEVGLDAHQDADGPRLVGPSLRLDLPIFDQRQGEIARLEGELRRAQSQLRALAVDTRSEVREASARLLASRQLVLHLERSVLPLHAQVMEHSQLQYNGMQIGLYRLMDAKREQLEAQRQHAEALREYWVNRVSLERLLGGRLPTAGEPQLPNPRPASPRTETPHTPTGKDAAHEHDHH